MCASLLIFILPEIPPNETARCAANRSRLYEDAAAAIKPAATAEFPQAATTACATTGTTTSAATVHGADRSQRNGQWRPTRSSIPTSPDTSEPSSHVGRARRVRSACSFCPWRAYGIGCRAHSRQRQRQLDVPSPTTGSTEKPDRCVQAARQECWRAPSDAAGFVRPQGASRSFRRGSSTATFFDADGPEGRAQRGSAFCRRC